MFSKILLYPAVLMFISSLTVADVRPDAALSAPADRADDQLGISAGGHYFKYQGKVMMMIGDSGTQCVPQNLNLDYRAWIDDLSDRGIKGVHVWAIQAR